MEVTTPTLSAVKSLALGAMFKPVFHPLCLCEIKQKVETLQRLRTTALHLQDLT